MCPKASVNAAKLAWLRDDMAAVFTARSGVPSFSKDPYQKAWLTLGKCSWKRCCSAIALGSRGDNCLWDRVFCTGCYVMLVWPLGHPHTLAADPYKLARNLCLQSLSRRYLS